MSKCTSTTIEFFIRVLPEKLLNAGRIVLAFNSS